MQKKVLLIYPEIPTTYWSFKYSLPFMNYRSAMPPLGLLTVAALMPANYNLKLIDMNVYKLTEADIKDADIVFVSAMIVQKESLLKVVRLCNDCGVPAVAGGPYPSSSYKEIEGVDYFVLNEAEITLPEFIKDYEQGRPEKIYTSDIKPDITRTPVPRFDLIDDLNVYASMALQYSRGCPFNCEFCDIIEMLGRNQRTKDPDQFIGEIDALYNIGFRGSLFIVDDNFIGNKSKVKALLRAIIGWQRSKKFPFVLFTEASINVAHDEELLDLMVDAGFNSVFVGIESPDVNTLASTQKLQNLREDILTNIITIQRKGIEVLGGFIVGFDADPQNIFDMQIEFIRKAGIPTAMVGMLTALPNTQLYKRLEAEGRLTGNSTGNNTHGFQINFVPKIPVEKLIKGYKHIISEIYKPRNYFERCLTLLLRLPFIKYSNKSPDMQHLKAFFMSLLKQGFSRYGFTYLKYLYKVVVRKPKLFVLAVVLAIKGYHYFKITEEIIRADEFSSLLDKYLKGLYDEVAKITNAFNENALIILQIEKYILQLKNKTRKKYQRLSYDMQNYLNDHLAKFDLYCDAVISQWKDKLFNKED